MINPDSKEENYNFINNSTLLLYLIPNEIYFYIISFLSLKDLLSLSQTSKFFQSFINDNFFWKAIYQEKWLKNGDKKFIEIIYPKNFNWKKMYQKRIEIEKKYLVLEEDDIIEDEWKKYFKRGNKLCKYETEDLNEFLDLSIIEQEEYISCIAYANMKKDKISNKNFGKNMKNNFLIIFF